MSCMQAFFQEEFCILFVTCSSGGAI